MQDVLEAIGFYRSEAGGADSPVSIQSHRIYFELITEGAVYAPGENVLRGVGTIFVHRAGQETVARTEGGGKYACVTARYKLSSNHSKVEWPRWVLWEDVKEFSRFTEDVLHAYHRSERDRQIIGDYVWSQLRYRLNQYQHQPHRSGIPPRLAHVLTYIERHYHEPIDTDVLAAQVELSGSHLHTEFLKHLRVTPYQHVIRQRMHAARHRLATTNDPVKQVAVEVGYANTENFCRAFKKLTGMTAAGYRQKYRVYEN